MMAAACMAGAAFSALAQDIVIINQDTEWPYQVQSQSEPGNPYGEAAHLFMDSDITINGNGGLVIDARGIQTILEADNGYDFDTRYSLSVDNGSLAAETLTFYMFSSISFTNAGSQNETGSLMEASSVNTPHGDQYNSSLATYITVEGFRDNFTFTGNGTTGDSVPQFGIKSWAELSDSSVYASSVQSRIAISGENNSNESASVINFSDNAWDNSAIYAYAAGMSVSSESGTAGPTDISSSVSLSGVELLQFENNRCGNSLIAAYTRAEPGTESIEYSYQQAQIILSADRINISNNTANGENGLISALLEGRPKSDGWRLNQKALIEINQTKSAIFRSNRAAGNGGVLSSVLKPDSGYSGSVYDQNNDAGGVNISLGDLIGDMVFENNHADGKGGAIYTSGGFVTIMNSTNIEGYREDPETAHYSSDIIFKGNTMGDGVNTPIIANSIYAEGNSAYDGGLDRFCAWTGTRIVFEGSVISKPTGDQPRTFHINNDNSLPTRSAAFYAYTGTVLFTGENVRQVITRQDGESEASYASRLEQSLTSTIEQDTMLHNGMLAVRNDAKLVIKNFYITEEHLALDEDTGNYTGAMLNTDFKGLIHVQGSADFSGLADISLASYLDGAAGANAIRMKIDLDLSGRFEIMNHGNLYQAGKLNDSMVFILLTLMIEDGDTDVLGLETSADRFNEGLGLDNPDDQWKLEWIYGIDGAETKSLILHKQGAIPEPSGILLALFGLAGFAIRRR